MKLYWACAKYIDTNGREDSLFTYNSSSSLAEAQNVIKVWADEYKFNIIRAWVDVYEHGLKVETIHCTSNDCLV